MAPITEESSDLEVMRKEDSSWHPCRVSLSSSNASFGIIVDFESCTEEDIISDREDALTRLRLRSTPLQDGECSHIKEGESVLAMHKAQSRSMFFDAVVEKPYRVKHSNRVHCRCTFEIKWLNSDMKGQTMTVPSKSIMKLSNKSIGNHPVFAAFLNAMSSTNGEEVPSFLTLLEETNCEVDLHGILEKQIEEISRLVDGSKEGSADLLLEVKRVNLSGRKQNKAVVTSHLSPKNSQNDFRRSTRSQNKQELEVEVKKESEEDKPFLSPLAARAALASLVHELPLKPDFSICHEEKEDRVDLLKKDSEKFIQLHSLDVACEYVMSDATFEDSVPVVSNPTQITDSETPLESRHACRPSVSNRRIAAKKSKPNESPDQEKPLQASKESEAREVNGTTSSVIGGKPNRPASTPRLTRSALQKEILVSSDEVKKGSSSEKLARPVSTTRLTRSAMLKEESNLTVKQDLGKCEPTQDTQDVSEDHVQPDGKESKKKRLISSPMDPDTELTLEKKKRTRASRDVEVTKEYPGVDPRDSKISPGEKKKAISAKKAELRFSPRLKFLPRTRSQKKASPAC